MLLPGLSVGFLCCNRFNRTVFRLVLVNQLSFVFVGDGSNLRFLSRSGCYRAWPNNFLNCRHYCFLILLCPLPESTFCSFRWLQHTAWADFSQQARLRLWYVIICLALQLLLLSIEQSWQTALLYAIFIWLLELPVLSLSWLLWEKNGAARWWVS